MAAISLTLKTLGLNPVRCLINLAIHPSTAYKSPSSPALRVQQQQRAHISGKALRQPTVKKLAPFPYKEKKLGLFRTYWEVTTDRFDENTKVIVVEGNIAAGKTTFAKALAEDLDMLYVPEATMDFHYVNEYGYDLRDYRHLLPESVKTFDIPDFYNNPKHRSVANFQVCMYRARFQQYLDTMAHILNTGQGVVLDRCAYSDFCFLETMYKFGYISAGARKAYYEIKQNTIGELFRPHLVIYLDVPVNVIQDRIKKRGHEYEMNTNVLSTDYLQTLADVYKYQYLKEISKHAELLIYDWSNFGEVEVVVEDIERIDFDHFEKYDEKMMDWRIGDEIEWRELRYRFTRCRGEITALFNIPILDVPEMFPPTDDASTFWEVWQKVPGNKFEKGYNADLGDKGILFKSGFKWE